MIRGVISMQVHNVRDEDAVDLVAAEGGVFRFPGGDFGGILQLGHGCVRAPSRRAQDFLHLQTVLRTHDGRKPGLRIGLQSLWGVAQGHLGAHPVVIPFLREVSHCLKC